MSSADAINCDRLFAALAVHAEVGTGTGLDVCAAQPDELGGSQPGLDAGQQQGVIPPAGPGGPVGRSEQGGDLGCGEVGDQGPVGSPVKMRAWLLGRMSLTATNST